MEVLQAQNAFRALALQALAGIFLALGAYHTARTLRINRESQVAGRYSSAVSQLGNESVEIRVGGIYALETVARDSPRDHQAVVDVLVAFIRRSSERQTLTNEYRLAEDLEAAVRVVGRLPRPSWDRRLLRLSVVHLQLGRFEDLDLKYIDFTYANLAHTVFAGSDLSYSQLAFADIHESGFAKTLLHQTSFGGSDLMHAWFQGADAEGADFSRAKLGGADFSGRRHEGSYRIPPTVLTDADFEDAELSGANLEGVDLARSEGLTDAAVAGAILDDATRLPPGVHRPSQRVRRSRARSAAAARTKSREATPRRDSSTKN